MFPVRDGNKHGTKSTESTYAKIEYRFFAHAFELVLSYRQTPLTCIISPPQQHYHMLNTNVTKVGQADHPSEAGRLHIVAIFQGRPYKTLGCEVQ